MAIRRLVAVSRVVWDGATGGAIGEDTAMTEQTWVDVRQDTRRVAVVTIDNSAKLNTLNTRVMTALIGAVEKLGTDDGLRAVVLRGAGERAFIGGADIAEMSGLDPASARAFITLVHRCCDVFRRLPVPVIARIQGYVFGAGVEVAAACDMRVASADATFGMPEVRLGVPSVVEAALLPQLIGWGRTRQFLLTGDAIDAATAQSWGLVEEVAPVDQLDAAVERLLDSILASGPHAIRLQKALITSWEDLPLREAIRRGIDSFAASWNTDEPRRMMQDFADLRRRRKLGEGQGGTTT
jgi:enoyl-CoA hydratase/carnithine racemase